MSYIETYTGHRFDYDAPTAEMIDPVDIAMSLGRLCRFAGHCQRFYTVGQHCVYVSHRFQNRYMRRIGLLHDATEAYVVDVPSPLKQSLGDVYRDYEWAAMCAICERFGLVTPVPSLWDELCYVDDRMKVTEARSLFARMPEWAEALAEPYEMPITPWSMSHAQRAYAQRGVALGLWTRDEVAVILNGKVTHEGSGV